MTSQEILGAELLDILFDNRNKEYGAYNLRKFYNNRLGIALGMALGILLLVFLLSRFIHSAPSLVGNNDYVIVRTFDILPKVKPEEPKPVTPKPASTPAKPIARQRFTDQFAIVNTKPLFTMPDQQDLKDPVISNVTTSGHVAPPGIGDPGPGTSGGGTAAPAAAEPPKEELIQREPQFPGGTKAWLDFLRRNLQAPEELETGERKTVLIRFQVAADGAVTGFEVVQSGGSNYDEEVMRVLRKMPRWKPALVNSQPVVRFFTQPVTFEGQ